MINILIKYSVIILLLIFTEGCGIKTIEKENCISSFVLEPTKSVKFFILDVLEGKKTYSSLELKENERFLCISEPHISNSCKDNYPPIKIKSVELPLGTQVFFTGNIKKTVPFGFAAAFDSEITYLEGLVNNKKVWLATYNLLSIKDYADESLLNSKSLMVIDLDSLSFNIECN